MGSLATEHTGAPNWRALCAQEAAGPSARAARGAHLLLVEQYSGGNSTPVFGSFRSLGLGREVDTAAKSGARRLGRARGGGRHGPRALSIRIGPARALDR